MAEALLYADKISDSIEHLNVNVRLETDEDISFVSTNSLKQDSDPNQNLSNETNQESNLIKSKLS